MLPFAMRRFLSISLTILSISAGCLLFYSLEVYAAAPPQPTAIAQVIWVKGPVRASQPNQTSRALERRSPLFEGDTITTDQTGTGQIAFTDGSVVVLREDTQFKIDEYNYKKGEPVSKAKSVMSVVTGGFRTITGIIPKENPDGYQVNTPVATIGVRGTDYSVYIDPVQGLLLDLNKGAIVVRNSAGSLVLNKGLGTAYGAVSSISSSPVVLANKPPVFNNQPPAKPVTPQTIDSISSPAPKGSVGKDGTVSSFCVG